MMEPQEIPDEEYEQLIERVAAIDVAKANAKICTRTPHESKPAQRQTRVWDVTATVNAIVELGDHLRCQGIQKVTVESTGDYWRIWFYLLEAHGLDVQLVNARDVKNLPGRPKTDKLDAVWLAKLTEKGMLRPSFVPPQQIRILRDYTRMRSDLIAERTRHWQRVEKLLEDALIKMSSVVSTLTTPSARDMIEALIAGECDPRVLAELARGRMRSKIPALVEALTGRFDDHHAELARLLLNQIDTLDAAVGHLAARIEALIAELPVSDDSAIPAPDRLDEIPGINLNLARVIMAEIGLDMSRFPTADHLVSWAKLCPRTIQSGATTRSAKAGRGNPYLKAALGNAAAAASRTDTFLGERYRRIAKRRGRPKALVAVARSILVIVWHLLANPTSGFHDLGVDYHANRTDRDNKTRAHIRQLQALGFTVTLTPAA
ncbi:IS110 family transposase [Nonomuraea sp. NPDC005650]|uniref:IS110 family transposase n=1 Tax=Nonomuraea sp. NPDC005650 TaxID=3157045 RepID=UPI0033B4775F